MDVLDVKRNRRTRHTVLHTVFGLVWLGTVIGGLALVAGYDNTPGAAARHDARWPAESQLETDASAPTLVMVAHPLCTCTRASLEELGEIMARTRTRLRAYVVFAGMDRLQTKPSTTALWDQASRISGVIPIADVRGREAAAFGAETSGQVYLYGPDGQLLFSGGTTRARGHRGESVSRESIVALLAQQPPARTSTPVFGCPLHGPADSPLRSRHHDHDDHTP